MVVVVVVGGSNKVVVVVVAVVGGNRTRRRNRNNSNNCRTNNHSNGSSGAVQTQGAGAAFFESVKKVSITIAIIVEHDSISIWSGHQDMERPKRRRDQGTKRLGPANQ